MSKREISCPRCSKPTLFTPENPFRPFCSERCKLIDLGHWADGTYAIPVGGAPGAENEAEVPTDANAEPTEEDASDMNPALH